MWTGKGMVTQTDVIEMRIGSWANYIDRPWYVLRWDKRRARKVRMARKRRRGWA